jgi:hypothetical protein
LLAGQTALRDDLIGHLRIQEAATRASAVPLDGLTGDTMSQADSIKADKTLLVNMSLNELTSRIESIAPNSGKLVLPILLNGTLSGVNIPDNVRGYPILWVSGNDYRIYYPPGKLQYYVLTLLEFESQQASVQIKSVWPSTITVTPPFGVYLTINYVKASGAWVISSVEGGVFPEG